MTHRPTPWWHIASWGIAVVIVLLVGWIGAYLSFRDIGIDLGYLTIGPNICVRYQLIVRHHLPDGRIETQYFAMVPWDGWKAWLFSPLERIEVDWRWEQMMGSPRKPHR